MGRAIELRKLMDQGADLVSVEGKATRQAALDASGWSALRSLRTRAR